MSAPPFEGVGVALVTLFDEEGALDASATASLAGELVEAGVAAVVVAGTTGEAAALDPTEREELLRAVRTTVPAGSGVPLLAGTGAPSAHQAAALTARARDCGVDGVLVLSPPGQADLRRYYDRVREAAGELPVLAYHFPAVSSPGIPLDVLADLPVDGCKDSSRDPSRLLLEVAEGAVPIYTGSAALLALAGPLGCRGAILALANAEPERCAAAFAGDATAQLELAEGERALSASFPAGVKELTARRFNTSRTCRLG